MPARTRLHTIAVLVPLFVAACGPRWTVSPPASDGPGGLLLVGSRAGVSALQPLTGAVAFTAPPATLAPGRTQLVDVRAAGSSTRVAALDATSGHERSVREVPGSFSLGAVSSTGRVVALVAGEPDGYGGHRVGKERTTLIIADTSGEASPRRIEVMGNVEPEAFSSDERSLFVIDYLPPSAPDRYRVRRLDVDTGAVSPVQTRAKLLVEEEMRGSSRQQVWSPDGRVLYTLYVKEGEHVHARDQVAAGGSGRSSGAAAFVHVLHLAEQWAFCLDLPTTFGPGPAGGHALAISPDGSAIYVANWSTGSVAAADTRTFELRHRAKGFRDESAGQTAVARAGNRVLYLAGGDRLLAIDKSTLSVVGSHAAVGPISALELSSGDERRLYVGLTKEVAVLDPHTWGPLPSLPVGGAEWMARVGPSR